MCVLNTKNKLTIWHVVCGTEYCFFDFGDQTEFSYFQLVKAGHIFFCLYPTIAPTAMYDLNKVNVHSDQSFSLLCWSHDLPISKVI